MNQRCTRELLTRECDGLQSDRGRRILPPHAQTSRDASRRRGWSRGALGRRPEKARRLCLDCRPALCSRPHALEWWHLGMAEWRPLSGWRWRRDRYQHGRYLPAATTPPARRAVAGQTVCERGAHKTLRHRSRGADAGHGAGQSGCACELRGGNSRAL